MSTSVDAILKYKRKEDEDFYGILGCDELASAEQITAEYKVLALQCHPDKNPDDPNAEARFQLMKEAKETLCDPARRANYDKWRNSGISIGYRQWLGMKEHVHQSMHWSTMKTKDRMLAEGATSQGPPSTSLGAPSGAQRRASEGGANIHYGGRNPAQWTSDPPSEVVAKFRNYEI